MTGFFQVKERAARSQAEEAWKELPERIRQRSGMMEKQRALTQTSLDSKP